jgi:hypothetical protein
MENYSWCVCVCECGNARLFVCDVFLPVMFSFVALLSQPWIPVKRNYFFFYFFRKKFLFLRIMVES